MRHALTDQEGVGEGGGSEVATRLKSDKAKQKTEELKREKEK